LHMFRTAAVACLWTMLASSALAQGNRGTLAFTHVSVVDATDSTPRRDRTVVVRDGRIVAEGPSAKVRAPAGARVVDARGKYLIPGLWDMHVHTTVVGGRDLLRLYVANGVTGVRDMAGEWDTLRTWRSDIAAGRLVGPRIVASGPYIEGGDVPIPHLLARNPAEAVVAVDSLAALGVDFIKLHTQLNRETYLAALHRAREKGLAVGGHVPRSVGAEMASDSGLRSIEHMLAIPVPCSAADSAALEPRFSVQGALGRCSTRDLAPLYAKFVRNKTWVTPTMVAAYEIAWWPNRNLPGDSLAGYLPDTLRKFVLAIFPMPEVPPGSDSVGMAVFRKRLAQVAAMRRAGVGILTGTDAPLRNSPPGFGLHEELWQLARGGMSNRDLIRAATLEPALYFGIAASAGTIAVGKRADLVLLDANPLVDIRNTRRISGVVAAGRYIGPAQRERLLRQKD
jgi:imidazolonepropionase-like amidohydrolase